MNIVKHCTNPNCTFYYIDNIIDDKWYHKKGSFYTKKNGSQKRYQCKKCGKTFSNTSFTINYYTQKKINYRKLLNNLVSSSGIRHMSRTFKCSPNLIINRIRRLSHQIMGVLSCELGGLKLNENLCADGIENFIDSQYVPNMVNLLVGKRSRYLYTFDSYHFKRKGRMRKDQADKMKILSDILYFEKGAATKSFNNIIKELSKLFARSERKMVILDTDELPLYRRQLRENPYLKELKGKTLLHRITSSKKKRDFNNKLFACNYYDRELRKDLAEMTRETICFGRSTNNSNERLVCYSFWHNYIKDFKISILKKPKITHAFVAGINKGKISKIVKHVFRGDRMSYRRCIDKINPLYKKIWLRLVAEPSFEYRSYIGKFSYV